MNLYLDTSAAAKLMLDEPETAPLLDHLARRKKNGARINTSWLTQTELLRAAQRVGQPMELATSALETMEIAGLARDVYVDAGLMPGRHLRSLDALHIVIAQRLQASEFITYDAHQSEAASRAGLTVVSPS